MFLMRLKGLSPPLRLLLGISIAFLCGFLLLMAYWVFRARSQAQLWVHPVRHVAEETPTDVGLPVWETVTFPTSEGLELAGWLIAPVGEANGYTVILVHGLAANRSAMLTRAVMLAQNGYQTFLFDLRNHGESQGEVTTVGYLETQDVLAAAAYLRSRPDVEPTQIAVWGHSLGAVAVMNAAADDPTMRAVIAESGLPHLGPEVTTPIVKALTGRPPTPSPAWVLWFVDRETGVPASQLDVYVALEQITPRPILFVHGMDDTVVPMENSEKMFAAANEPKQLYLIAGAGHANLSEPDPLAYAATMLQFLELAFAGSP
jgi:dipeptidyl aminopeptidase/acylaminoacyl peptidase